MKDKSTDISDKTAPLSAFVVGYMRLNEWGFSAQQILAFLESHMELGITSVDHADIYGSYQCEALFGAALRLKPELRDQIQIVSKCGIKLLSENRPEHRVKHYDTTRRHIIQSVENSLANLCTDYLDVLLIHRPDPLMDVDEVAATFEELAAQGKVLQFGVSNFAPAQFDLLQSRMKLPLCTNQVELSPFNVGVLEDGTLDHCQLHNISPMIWAPLGGGRMFTGADEESLRIRTVLQEMARRYDNAPLDQIVMAWVMAHPSQPKPILGSKNLERIASAVSSQNLKLERQDWFEILHAAMGKEVP